MGLYKPAIVGLTLGGTKARIIWLRPKVRVERLKISREYTFGLQFYDCIFWHLMDSIVFSTFLKHHRNSTNTETASELRLRSVQVLLIPEEISPVQYH